MCSSDLLLLTVEFASWNDKFATEAVAPVLNKVGAFTANPLVRNIIGQPRSSFNIRQIMDERKILIVNLSRGLVGEDNAALLGALIVTKMQMAAMGRADIDAEHRVPFYLYVDDVDAVYARALAAGAKSLSEPEDQFWGDRFAQIEDPDGYRWALARHLS